MHELLYKLLIFSKITEINHFLSLGAVYKYHKAYKFFDSFSSPEEMQPMMILSSIFDTEWSLGRFIFFGAGLTKIKHTNLTSWL